MSAVQKFDDTDPLFRFDTNWTPGTHIREFNGTHHNSTSSGAQVTFGPFQGMSNLFIMPIRRH